MINLIFITITRRKYLLFSELLSNILGRATGYVNPGLAEEGAAAQHEGDVEDGVDGIGEDGAERLRRREIVAQTPHWVGAATSGVIPHTEQVYKEVSGKLNTQHLGYHVEIGDQGRLEDDGNVGSVEQFDGITAVLASVAGALDGQVNPEALEVYHHSKDEDCCEEVHQVGEVLPVEGLPESSDLVLPGCQEMEESDHGSLELGATSGVDSSGAESLPDDGFADVGSDKQRYSRAQTFEIKRVMGLYIKKYIFYRILSAEARRAAGQSDQPRRAE